jgi:predicted acetyltransferase
MSLSTQLGAQPNELEQLARVVSWAYAESEERAKRWLLRSNVRNVRVGQADGKVVAGLVEIQMGQWFGGRSVSTLGIAGVAVAAEARGAGHALELLRQSLQEARARGVALSTLYPSTPKLYRKVGYEYAGAYCRSSLPLTAELRSRSELTLTELQPQHADQVEALYRQIAALRPGYLDRGAFIWDYVRVMNDKPVFGMAALGPRGLEGYAYIAQNVTQGSHHDLVLKDFVAVSGGATHALLQFLARHSTTADHVAWYGSAADGRLLALADRTPKVEVSKHWMLRLVDVERALCARGYPALSVAVDLQVDDPVLSENTGLYRLQLADGVMTVSRSKAAGGARIGCGALAALYSGFVGAEELMSLGLLEAEPADARALSAIFQGPSPAVADFF